MAVEERGAAGRQRRVGAEGDYDDQQLEASLRPVSPMPPMGLSLQPQALEDVMAFLTTLT